MVKEYEGQFKKLKDSMEDLITSMNSIIVQINQSAARSSPTSQTFLKT
ncbi:MAG: hypothetical protein ACOX7I_04245 [Oscillospiraceae bacterium]